MISAQQPEPFSQNDKAMFVCVCVYQCTSWTHTQAKEPFNQSPCLGIRPVHSYSSDVVCAYFISPTIIDLSSEVSPCFISLPSHRSPKRLLPWTSTGSHSIWRWKSGACHPDTLALREISQHHGRNLLWPLSNFLLSVAVVMYLLGLTVSQTHTWVNVF